LPRIRPLNGERFASPNRVVLKEVTVNQAKRIFYVAGVALASLSGVAMAQQPQPMNQPPPTTAQPPTEKGTAPPTEVVGRLEHTSATVQKVDTKKRELALKDEAGKQTIVQVPEGVTRLERVKKGDRVDVDYYESVALSLKKPGEATSPTESEKVVPKEGKLPGGLVARQISAPVKVVKVDPAANKLTIKSSDGDVDTINVSNPDLQADLRKLKEGDQIQVTYSEAVAASVTPKQK
jgi:Cu/Ag efflux protein CusF